MSTDNTIEAGWRTFREEVLQKGWPENPVLEMLVEVAFFGGAGWAMELTHDDPGARLRILAEIACHHMKVRKRHETSVSGETAKARHEADK